MWLRSSLGQSISIQEHFPSFSCNTYPHLHSNSLQLSLLYSPCSLPVLCSRSFFALYPDTVSLVGTPQASLSLVLHSTLDLFHSLLSRSRSLEFSLMDSSSCFSITATTSSSTRHRRGFSPLILICTTSAVCLDSVLLWKPTACIMNFASAPQ